MSISVILGDITKIAADVIVNAANESLLGGGGVDGAIHRAAGPNLFTLCAALGGCRTGEAKISPAFQIKTAKYIVHTVGPVWDGGNRGEAEKLASCYTQSLRLAEIAEAKSVAFPAISTGIYGYPKQDAARVAITAIREFQREHIQEVILVCFSPEDADIYHSLFS